MNEPVEAAEHVEERKPIEQKLVYKGFLHVGDGAEDCPDDGRGCEDEEHFHAFCRLPNQFQQRDIRNKALAAKARTVRRLDDPESDGYEVLEADMESLRNRDARSELVEELMGQESNTDILQAIGDVKDEHAEDFATVDDDILRLKDVEEGDERDELLRHTQRYWDLVTEAVKQRQEPRRQGFEQLDTDELVRRVREIRADAISTAEFLHTYGEWREFLCTYEPDKRTRKFESLHDLHEADEDVLTALRVFFERLEQGIPHPKG